MLPEADRVRNIEDTPFWLDKMEITSTRISGRFCRKQSTNLPAKAMGKTSLVPLGFPELGRTVAWRYDPNLGVMAIESSRTGLSIGRLLAYVRAVCDCRGYGTLPVTADANLEAIKDGRVREIVVQLATPKNLQTVAAYQQTVTNGMTNLMSEGLGTLLEVRYSLRVGDPDMAPGRVDRFVRWLRGEHSHERGAIAKISARVIGEEGDSEVLNMLDVHLQYQDDLALPNDDPDHSYVVRKAFMMSAFNKHEATLAKQFGP